MGKRTYRLLIYDNNLHRKMVPNDSFQTPQLLLNKDQDVQDLAKQIAFEILQTQQFNKSENLEFTQKTRGRPRVTRRALPLRVPASKAFFQAALSLPRQGLLGRARGARLKCVHPHTKPCAKPAIHPRARTINTINTQQMADLVKQSVDRYVVARPSSGPSERP